MVAEYAQDFGGSFCSGAFGSAESAEIFYRGKIQELRRLEKLPLRVKSLPGIYGLPRKLEEFTGSPQFLGPPNFD